MPRKTNVVTLAGAPYPSAQDMSPSPAPSAVIIVGKYMALNLPVLMSTTGGCQSGKQAMLDKFGPVMVLNKKNIERFFAEYGIHRAYQGLYDSKHDGLIKFLSVWNKRYERWISNYDKELANRKKCVEAVKAGLLAYSLEYAKP